MRMPSMSAAFLMVIVMRRIIASGPLESRVSTGVAPLPTGVRSRASRHPPDAPSRDRPRPSTSPRFEGGNALSAFRAAGAARRGCSGCVARIDGVAARHVHWVWSDAPLDARRRATGSPRCCATASPYDAAGRRRAGRRRAAPRHGLAVGLEGDRHRAQLRPRDAPDRARHRVPAGAEERPARRRASRLTADELQRRRGAAARPHDRERRLRRARTRAHLFDEQPARADGARRRARRRPRRAGAANARVRPGAVRRRDRLPGRRLHRARPQPERRRADDVRAGQQRALPAQDLQRRRSRSTA